MVANEVVVWMSDPEAGWSLISVQQTPRSLCLDDAVVSDIVPGLNGIFDEDRVALDFIGNVLI
jgi:hypothetical protein